MIEVKRRRKVYRIKKLIAGYKIDKSLAGKIVVAVPAHQIHSNLLVELKGTGERMRLRIPLYRVEFKDKYGRGDYELVYYEWKPETNPQMQLF